MEYAGMIPILIILILVFRITFLRKRYGEKKGDFIAMTLMLTTLPFIFLSNIPEIMGAIFQWLLVLTVLINWFYSLYVFKSSPNK